MFSRFQPIIVLPLTPKPNLWCVIERSQDLPTCTNIPFLMFFIVQWAEDPDRLHPTAYGIGSSNFWKGFSRFTNLNYFINSKIFDELSDMFLFPLDVEE